MGVPRNRVLQNIRSTADSGYARLHMTNRQDIYNIGMSHGIGNNVAVESIVTAMSDADSVYAWVRSCEDRGENNPVLLYKQQGQELNGLDSDDFFLGLMNPIQKAMFKKFGQDRILIDSTHGVTGHDFLLTTIMVVDEFGEGFPVAFLLSTRTNVATLTKFFACVKDAVGLISCSVFMSDDDPAFYTAWCSVMGHAERRLLCSWHVDRAWSGKLNIISDQTERDAVYKALKSCQVQLSQEKFQKNLEKFISMAKEKSPKFLEYFLKFYANRSECWAYCFRLGARLNTNMRIERYHRELKAKYLENKTVKRVDKAIEAMFELVFDKEFDRHGKLSKGKANTRFTELNEHHNGGLKLANEVNELNDLVYSIAVDNREYTVSLTGHECSESCTMRCRRCRACYYLATCSCIDYGIHGVVCKHIHAVCLQKFGTEDYHNITLTTNPDELKERQQELDFLHSDIADQCTSRGRDPCKNAIAIKNVLVQLSALADTQELDSDTTAAILQHLNSAKRLFGVSKESVAALSKPTKSSGTTKLMSPQKRFFSVHKKGKRRKVHSSKATGVEADILEAHLMGDEEVIECESLLDTGFVEPDIFPDPLSNQQQGQPATSLPKVDIPPPVRSSTLYSQMRSSTVPRLSHTQQQTLLEGRELDDVIVYVASDILSKQFPKVIGLQSSLLYQVKKYAFCIYKTQQLIYYLVFINEKILCLINHDHFYSLNFNSASTDIVVVVLTAFVD